MNREITHASFFSGVGGVDLGLERAGWRTVSFSEIDPYACASLAHNWPGVPNLGSIVDLADRARGEHPGAGGRRDGRGGAERTGPGAAGGERRIESGPVGPDWTRADLWTGGFPCQDLSVAGKRRGMGTHDDRLDTRSGLAYAFLDLVERYRPPAIILENVPGLLSSHGGRDLGALIGRMEKLGYVGAFRVLDARFFGVPQRRRRVFIVALDARLGATAERATEVLSVGTRCDRHPASGVQAGPGAAAGAAPGVDIARAVTGSSGKRHDDDTDTLIADTVRSHPRPGSNSNGSLTIANAVRASDGHHGHGSPRGDGGDNLVVSPPPDTPGNGAADGLAGRLDDRAGVAFRKATKAHNGDDWERWEPADTTDALTASGLTPRTDVAVVSALDTMQGGADDNYAQAGRLVPGERGGPDDLLPDGLDSHRYRCCGNGVVAPVAEFIGERLRDEMLRLRQGVAA